jgi:hypothetical protein
MSQEQQELIEHKIDNHQLKHESEEDNQIQHRDRFCSVTLRSDCRSKLNKNKLINLIWTELFNTTEKCVLVYNGIDPETAYGVIKELDQHAEDRSRRYVVLS